MSNLSSLEYLWLTVNNFSGTLPHKIGKLPWIRYIFVGLTPQKVITDVHAGTTRLSGTFPPSLSPSMEQIDISLSRISGSVPDLGPNYKLQWLNANQTLLSSTLPDMISAISLNVLDVASTKISGTVPDFPANLEWLFLDDCCYLSGTIPASIGELSLVQIIGIQGVRISGTLPGALANLTRLETLELELPFVSGTLPQWLTSLTELAQLNIGGGKLSGTVPVGISSLTQLFNLLLYNQVT